MTYIVNRASAGCSPCFHTSPKRSVTPGVDDHQGGVATGIAASSGSVIMHRKMAATFAAVLLLASTSAGFAQGTGRGAPGGGGAGTPGIGAAPGIGTGGGAGTPGIGTGGSTNSSDTLPGMPPAIVAISLAISLAISRRPLPAMCLRLVRLRMRISRPNTWRPCLTNRAPRT